MSAQPPPVNIPMGLQRDNETRGFFERLTKSLYLVWNKQQKHNLGQFLDLTVASGVITVTSPLHQVIGEGGAADDVDTINGGVEGDEIVLRAQDSAVTITFMDGTGNLALSGNFAADHNSDLLTLVFDGTNWLEKSRSNNA